jgi:hypothetical protein
MSMLEVLGEGNREHDDARSERADVLDVVESDLLLLESVLLLVGFPHRAYSAIPTAYRARNGSAQEHLVDGTIPHQPHRGPP